jgi:hypothetical protein
MTGGLIRARGENKRTLAMAAVAAGPNGVAEIGYYELDGELKLRRVEDRAAWDFAKKNTRIPAGILQTDEASVVFIDENNHRWRLPKGDTAFDQDGPLGPSRVDREVATERDLFNAHGTFYELPAENADGFAKIRPIASHNFRIHDYASYRGMIVITGLNKDVQPGEHIVVSDDGKAAVWLGAIDDLWEMGKPTGHGGPWKNSSVKAGEPSDPYLIGFYDKRSLEISHQSAQPVTFRIEVEPVGHGPWMLYKEVKVNAGEPFKYEFPAGFQARWIRFVADNDCTATAWLEYN